MFACFQYIGEKIAKLSHKDDKSVSILLSQTYRLPYRHAPRLFMENKVKGGLNLPFPFKKVFKLYELIGRQRVNFWVEDTAFSLYNLHWRKYFCNKLSFILGWAGS